MSEDKKENPRIELFSIKTEEHDEFSGKSLDMLKHLLNNCGALSIGSNSDYEIELTFYKG